MGTFIEKKDILTLTHSLKKNINNNNIMPSISIDGSLIYLVYSNDNSDNNATGNLSAELFKNSEGTLIPINKLANSSEYSIIKTGCASKKFNKFSIIDYSENEKNARIRILDQQFRIVLSREFVNYGYANFFNGGCFSDDGKYIIMTHYQEQKNEISTFSKGIIHIMDTESLQTIMAFRKNGIFYHSPKFFSLINNDKSVCTYIFVPFIEENITNNPQIYKFAIYKFAPNEIKLICENILPHELISFDISIKKYSAYIIIGTKRADLDKENISLSYKNNSYIPNDGNELRFYKFKYNKIKLVQSKNTQSNLVVSLCPQLKYSIVYHYNSQLNPGFFILNEIKHLEAKEGSQVNIMSNNIYYREGVPYFSAKFSYNGQWLIITGSEYYNIDYSINNIQLYRINN